MATTTEATKATQEKRAGQHPFVRGVHGVRYQVTDVARSVAFYTTKLGFSVEHQQLPAFASVSLGDAQLLLSGPQASGSRPMPTGQQQQPGGWNRVVLRVKDLPAFMDTLDRRPPFPQQHGDGPGGKQIQLEDPDNDPIKLVDPADGPLPIVLIIQATCPGDRRMKQTGGPAMSSRRHPPSCSFAAAPWRRATTREDDECPMVHRTE